MDFQILQSQHNSIHVTHWQASISEIEYADSAN